MIFALGFLAASLCALLLLPAVNARAARLSRRRIEARLPLSVAEVAAEKDYLRAQFAVAQRRLERKVETVQASRHADLAAIGARTMEVESLARTVEAREASLATTRTTLEGVSRDLETVRGESALGLATLQVLEEAHRDVLDDLRAIRHAGEHEPADAEPADAGTASPDLAARYRALVAERETLRASLAAAEEALAQVSAQNETDTHDLRRRISEVADALMQRERLPRAAGLTVPAES